MPSSLRHISILVSYPWTQWAAVITCRSEITAPPHTWDPVKFCNDAWWYPKLEGASWPPITRKADPIDNKKSKITHRNPAPHCIHNFILFTLFLCYLQFLPWTSKLSNVVNTKPNNNLSYISVSVLFYMKKKITTCTHETKYIPKCNWTSWTINILKVFNLSFIW